LKNRTTALARSAFSEQWFARLGPPTSKKLMSRHSRNCFALAPLRRGFCLGCLCRSNSTPRMRRPYKGQDSGVLALRAFLFEGGYTRAGRSPSTVGAIPAVRIMPSGDQAPRERGFLHIYGKFYSFCVGNPRLADHVFGRRVSRIRTRLRPVGRQGSDRRAAKAIPEVGLRMDASRVKAWGCAFSERIGQRKA
jgi:hypothetical protein